MLEACDKAIEYAVTSGKEEHRHTNVGFDNAKRKLNGYAKEFCKRWMNIIRGVKCPCFWPNGNDSLCSEIDKRMADAKEKDKKKKEWIVCGLEHSFSVKLHADNPPSQN